MPDGVAHPVPDGAAGVLAGGLPRDRDVAGGELHEFGDREDPEHHGDQGQIVDEIFQTHRIALFGHGLGRAHGREQQPHRRGGEPLDHRSAAQRAHHRKAEQGEGEYLRRAEGEDQRLDDGERDRQRDGTEHPAIGRYREGGAEGARRLAPLGERVPVEDGRLRRRGTRNPEHDRGDGVAGGGDGEQPEQERDRAQRLHVEGKREQQQHPDDAAEPGHRAEPDADEDPEPEEQQDLQLEDRVQAGEQGLKHALPSAGRVPGSQTARHPVGPRPRRGRSPLISG